MIISRYLIKEMGNALLAVTFILLLVFLCNQTVRYLSYAASGKVGANILLQLLGFEVPNLVALLLPLGTYLGIIFTLGRLYADNEMRVMQACGLSTRQLLLIIGTLAGTVTATVMVLTLWINPYFAAKKDKLITQSIATENIINNLVPGRFQVLGTADKQRVVYVEHVVRGRKEVNNLFYAEQNPIEPAATKAPNKPPAPLAVPTWNVLSATKGYQLRDHQSGDHFVVAANGFRYEGMPGQNNYKVIQFEKYAVRVPTYVPELGHLPQEVMPTSALLQHYNKNENAAELQWRLSIPLSAFLLAMLAVPLSQSRPRQGRYAQVFPAILIYVIYINLLFVARDWMQFNISLHFIGMWWVHVGLVLLILFAFLLRSHKRSQILTTYFPQKARPARAL